ncbi:MAG TPA: hypothetical protein VFG37_03200 [Planctomycetota bacterium]|nr:hypothetical protein [Planctomycetota bacterium]
MLLVATAAMLAFDTDRSDTQRRIAGLWRLHVVLLGAAVLWLGVVLLAGAGSRRAARRLAEATAIALLTLAWIELFGQVGLVDYRRLVGSVGEPVLGSRAVPRLDLRGTTFEDTAVAWGLPAAPVAFRFQTDRRGYRNAVDREGADVYLLGDSCLVAALLPFESTLCGRLEATLGRPVVNLALIGIGVQQERDLLRASGVPLAGRLVLHFVFEGNDQADSEKYRERIAGATPAVPRLETTFTWNALIRLQSALQPVDPIARRRSGTIGGTTYTFLWTADQFRGKEGEIAPILAALDETRRFVEAAGGRYAVVAIPDKIRILGPLCTWPAGCELADWRAHCSPLPQAVAQWAEERRVPELDLTDALQRAAAAGRIPWWPGDTHWNALGHEVAGQAVLHFLEEKRLLAAPAPR